MSELTDKDIEEMFCYKTQKSYNFGKYIIGMSYNFNNALS